MDYRGQGQSRPPQNVCSSITRKKKANSILKEIRQLWNPCRSAFKRDKSWHRAKALLLSALVCVGRHTITGLLCTSARQFQDWSADYRIFSRARFDPDKIFTVIRRAVLQSLKPDQPIVTTVDDSILRRTGTRMPGVTYQRDPLGPPFHVNFVRAQRILQISAALPPNQNAAPARMVPIDFVMAPRPPKPRKDAPEETWKAYRHKVRHSRVNHVGARRIQKLRRQLDTDEAGQKRALWVTGDGRFTNKPVLKGLPAHTVFIGRIRGDAKLYHLPSPKDQSARGRRRVYGHRAPTPEALRKDETVGWQTVKVFAAGKVHNLRCKTLAPLRWRSAGAEHDLRLIVIAPLAYRPRKGSKLLYRKPAYLICTDPNLPVDQVIRAYIWRWDIEVNFRDEKQLIGIGDAQLRSPASVETAPALFVAAYAILLLAAARAYGVNGKPDILPPPKWRPNHNKPRASTLDLIRHLRCELWGEALRLPRFSGFMDNPTSDQKPQKSNPDLASAILYAAG